MEENIKEKDKEIEKENGIDKEKDNGKTEIRKAPDRLDDIMLVMDMEKKTLGIASSNKDGKPKTVPADEKETENNVFLKLDKSNVVENFISNYLRQAKDPTQITFHRIPKNLLKTALKSFKDLKSNLYDPIAQSFFNKYEVDTDKIKKDVLNPLNNSDMAKKTDEQKQVSPAEEAKQAAAANTNQPKETRYTMGMVDWTGLRNLGITPENLKERGMLDQVLNGGKPKETVPVAINLGYAVVRADARISLRPSPEGPLTMAFDCIRVMPDFNKPYYGHHFTEEDKKNLLETGNMGRSVMMTPRGSDERVPYIISLDKITHSISAARVDTMNIPQEMLGVKFSDDEMAKLKDGKAVYIEGLYNPKSGKEFSANVQLNAEKRGLELIFDQNKQFNKQTLGGAKLSDQQLKDLNAGKTIFVEDMESKRRPGEKFSQFVTLKDGNMSFSDINPQTGEKYVPKEVHGVTLTHEDREDLRNGKVIFLKDMVRPNGEEFSSYVRTHPDTGRLQYSQTHDGFNDRPAPKIPQEYYGHTFTATERAALQDGKTLHLQGLKGTDGSEFSRYVKVNANIGRMETYSKNPDEKKEGASQSQANNTRQNTGQEKKKAAGVSM